MARWQYRYRTGPDAPWRYANALRQVRADAGWNPAGIQRRDNARKNDTGYHDYGTLERGRPAPGGGVATTSSTVSPAGT